MASFAVNHSIEFCQKECEKFCCWCDWSAFTCKQMLETEIRTNGYLRSFQILQRPNGSQMLISNWQSDKHSFLVWLEKKNTLSIISIFFFWKWFSLTVCDPEPCVKDAHVRLLHDLTRELPDSHLLLKSKSAIFEHQLAHNRYMSERNKFTRTHQGGRARHRTGDGTITAKVRPKVGAQTQF